MSEGGQRRGARSDRPAGRRSVARLFAVQALYEIEFGGANPEAVIADFQSGGTGASLELLDAIRRTRDFAEIPVLLLTHNETNRLYAWESGADAFLVRPFHADDLINEIYAVLTRSTDEREAWREEQLAAG